MPIAEQENTGCQSPATVAAKIFRDSPYQAIRSLTCTFKNGVLTIQGCLPNFHLTQVAIAAVRDIRGVQRVENRITVAR